MLDNTFDRIHIYYRVHRGIMDITLKKVKNPARFLPPDNPE
jgi:hypothetical protein